VEKSACLTNPILIQLSVSEICALIIAFFYVGGCQLANFFTKHWTFPQKSMLELHCNMKNQNHQEGGYLSHLGTFTRFPECKPFSTLWYFLRKVYVPMGWRLMQLVNYPSKQSHELSDQVLLASSVAGDDSAFECIVQRYQTPLYNFIGRSLGDYEQAFDVLQFVFM